MAAKAQVVTPEEVRSVPTPEGTQTWKPMPHATVMETVNHSLSSLGIGVRNERYELSRTGDNLFASLTLDIQHNGKSLQLGYRNSNSKQFAVGITAGTWTYVCSNLVFGGEYLEIRKHSGRFNADEMQLMANRAVSSGITQAENFMNWQNGLVEVPIGKALLGSREDDFRRDFEQLVFAAMATGAMPPSKFEHLIKAYRAERHNGDDTLYSFYSALTRVINTTSASHISERSYRINALAEFYEKYGIAPAASLYNQFEELEAQGIEDSQPAALPSMGGMNPPAVIG